MKILVWNSWITPAGGMERVALSLANGLAKRGRQVFLVGPYSRVPILESQIAPKVHYDDYPFQKTVKGLLGCANHLRRLVQRNGIDVISAHGSLIPLLPLKTPVVWTEHGLRYGEQKILSGLRSLPWHVVRRNLRSGKWHAVGCSAYVRDRLCEQFGLPAEAASVIYNGVPNPAALEMLPAPRFTPPYKLGFLGRMEPEKRPLDVFEIDKRLRKSWNLACEWHLFGDGSLLPEVRRRATAEGGGRIHVHGLVGSPAAAFQHMDLLTFLSHGEMEGLPTVLLEARHARRPAVAWEVTANPEAIGRKEWLVPKPFDLDRFAATIRAVLEKAETPETDPAAEASYVSMLDNYDRVLQRMCVRPRQLTH